MTAFRHKKHCSQLGRLGLLPSAVRTNPWCMRKSMRIKLDPHIKLCVTRTDPSNGIKSIGCRLTRCCLCFCRATLTNLSWQENFCPQSGQRHLDNFIMTRQFSSIYLDCAKTNPTLTQTATNSTAEPLGCNVHSSPSARLHQDCFAALPGQLNYFGTDS